MQGFDPQTILPRIAARGLEQQEIRPGDWFDDDGMLMCGKCGEPRQGMVTVSAPMEGNPENKMTFKATRASATATRRLPRSRPSRTKRTWSVSPV